ncbi:MAG: putative bifunctional diguanylate cyclase/phosphodiesterase [Nitrospirota bacterium]
MPLFRSFQGRILFFFVGLYILAQLLAFWAVDSASTQNARAHINAELESGGKIFDRVIQNRSERFLLAASILSNDFGFKTAFGSGDKRTVLSVLNNHKARIKADVMLLVSLERTIIADTLHPKTGPKSFPFPGMIRDAEKSGRASAMAFFDGRLYRFVVVPLRAPLPVAWVIVGFRIDDAMVQDVKTLTLMDVTFFVEEGGGRQALIAASTLAAELHQELGAVAKSSVLERHGNTEFTLRGETHLGLSRDLSGEGSTQVTVFLQRSLDAALEPFHQLRTKLAALFAGGLAVLLAGSVVISSMVTKPVRMLAQGAHSIEQGDYTCVLPSGREDELGRLSNAFNLMRDAIKQREEEIRYQAYYDILTGLANRSCLYQRLFTAINDAREKDRAVALIIVNIDRFNDVVAAFGHGAGKCILQNLAPLLKSAAPEPALVARIGGDVFAVMLAGGDVRDAVRIVQDVQKRLETPIVVVDAPIQIEARFGIAAYPAHGTDADSLLRLGDVAVHLAKGAPCGYVVYSTEMDRHNRRHLTLLAELRHAIDNNELMLYYQPKVNFATCRVTGAEALIRWKHSQYGFIGPDEFITLSEGTGLIRPVTSWTLKTAVSQCAELNRNNINLNMGINLSARVLPDQQLPDQVSSLFRDNNVHPGQFTLEVTESAIMSDPARTQDVINRLDSTGALLCVDDFGTGYSSLSYLQRLPVDELKIDKSFVQMMDTNQNDAVIVHSIIELAHNLGLTVTAEGVENQQVWDMLRSRGCDVAQGYLHGRPMPLDEFIAWSKQSPWGLGRC